jgi:SAM-dependent methyltransferase
MREELVMAVAASPPSETSTRLWRNFPGVFGKLKPPLRPSPSDVANIERGIAGCGGRVLLLGVTPELSTLGNELIAIDNSARMIEIVWPGDDHRRRAMIGDWTELPFDDGAFDAVIGDGSINSAPEVMEQVVREARRVLRPGGRAVFRMFCSPDAPESLDAIREDVELGWSGNLHALKWRIAMSLAAAMPDRIVAVQTILHWFDELFPDRSELASRTGWSLEEIATLDAYSGADHSMGFPTLGEMRKLAAPHLTHVSVLPGAGYPLAERCPTLVWSAD